MMNSLRRERRHWGRRAQGAENYPAQVDTYGFRVPSLNLALFSARDKLYMWTAGMFELSLAAIQTCSKRLRLAVAMPALNKQHKADGSIRWMTENSGSIILYSRSAGRAAPMIPVT
jgi:hypothetical protein